MSTSAIPAVPADIRRCFDDLTPAPQPNFLTAADVFALVERLRASEERKSRCGKRLIAWIDGLRGAQ